MEIHPYIQHFRVYSTTKAIEVQNKQYQIVAYLPYLRTQYCRSLGSVDVAKFYGETFRANIFRGKSMRRNLLPYIRSVSAGAKTHSSRVTSSQERLPSVCAFATRI